MQTKFESIDFQGVSGTIAAKIFSPSQQIKKCAVVFPGAGYAFSEPLLRYPIQCLIQKNYQVIALDKIYGSDPAWRNLTIEADARKVVEDDTDLVYSQIVAKYGPPDLLFGRSLGTFAIACLLEKKMAQPKQIVWQTPALGSKWSVMRDCGSPGFGILGTADYYYQPAIEHLPKDRIIIENADHAMEIPGDPIASVEILKQIVVATNDWIL